MKLILSVHNITLTKAIEDHIIEKLDKLGSLDKYAINARVTLEHDHSKLPRSQFKCGVRLTMPGPDLFAEDAESDLYAAIDLTLKKVEQQIRKRHSKFKARNHSEASRGKSKRIAKESGVDALDA